MIFNLWSKAEVDLLLDMLEDSASDQEISDEINGFVDQKKSGFTVHRSPSAVARKILRLQREAVLTNPKKETANTDIAHNTDQAWAYLRDLRKKYIDASKFDSTGLLTEPIARKILSLSDIHLPFTQVDMLYKAIDDHSDADIVVLNGDIMDGYIFSSFKKEKKVAAIDEFNCVMELVRICSEKFPQVVLVQGNHDYRSERVLNQSLQEDVLGVFQPDLLMRIANGEILDREGLVEEKLNFKNVFYPKSEKWWVQIGKTIFIHPHSRGSAKPGFTVTNWAKKFLERMQPSSFDSMVCGHTHQLYKGIQNSLLLIEQGCLCDYMSYSWQPKDVYHSSANNGYAVIYQDKDGNTDFNRSGFVYLGALLPVDKPLYNVNNNCFGGSR